MPNGALGKRYSYDGKGVNVTRTFSNNTSWSFSRSTAYVVMATINGEVTHQMGADTASYSIALVNSSIITTAQFTDMNGDGLPDYLRIDGENGNIRTIHSPNEYFSASEVNIDYNTGYSFVDGGRIPFDDYISKSELLGGTPAKVGVTWDYNRYSAGASVTLTNNKLKQCYMDLNGDGLPDKVKVEGDLLKIRYNTGKNFTDEVDQPINAGCISSSVNNSVGVSGSASVFGTIWIPFTPIFFTIGGTAGASGGISNNLNISDFKDINGDGFTDIILCDESGKIKTIVNNTRRTNLLKTVTNPLGGKINIDYERTANTWDTPNSKYVMSEVVLTDDKTYIYKYKYKYENGKYDRGEREFYGFSKVTETMPDDSTIEKEYSTDSFYRKGIETKTTVNDSEGDKYTVTTKTYTDKPTGVDRSYFVQLNETKTEYYEGAGSPQLISTQQYDYDQYGNVTRFTDNGDINDGSDNITADILYEYRQDTYLMALPVKITVTDSQGAVLRQRTGSYDHSGGLRTITQLSGNEQSTTSMDYYGDGNLKLVTYPANERSQRYGVTYTYDTDVNTYVSMVKDVFGLTSQSIYDPRFGTPKVSTDTNNNTMYYYYDTFGRTTRIVGPYDAGSYTISYNYDITTTPAKCITRNRGYHLANDSVDTIVTIDALKRVVSSAVSSEVNGSKGFTVSGAVVYDKMGRVTEQGQPRPSTDGSPVGMWHPTITKYDSIGRKTKIQMPDGTDVSFDYSVGSHSGKTALVTTVTDQMGRKKTTYKDMRDNILAVAAPIGTTIYEYNAIGEIQKVKDAEGKVTSIKYDGMGRRTEINNPDTGRTSFTYDPAGNMTRKITADLNAKGKAIKYHYDHNRLTQIEYPFMDDTYYTYGQTGSGNNRAGRVYKIDNGTVSEELYFGRLGETIKTVKTITDGETINSYTTKYTFDNLGRMRTLVYPDGEILTYDYDHGGLLKSAVGETSTGRKVYLENMTYDEFGQRTNVKYGNGAESTYEYEPVMRRLKNLKTTSAEGKTLQNIEYKYDAVGNITNRQNSGFNTNDDVSRSSEQSYGYDNMDRLETSEGKFDYETWNPFWDKRVNTYTNEFEYNVTGRILNKTQENKGLLTETGETVTIAETTYNWDYEYSSSHPNAVTKAGPREFNYDLNGNMTTMTDTAKSLTRTLNWDDENRLKKTTDSSGTNSIVTTYEYDASGMRALKKGKYGTVQYVSDNYTVRNKDLMSKHVFAGNTRLVSRVVMQEEKSGKMVATEQGSYYYHADHLGSSSVVTDKNGKFYEHIEYFPYGEVWVQNKATSAQESTPYKFTSKELDEETGLYYSLARYYDPRLSRWISADPVIDAYLEGKLGSGGVYNSINLNLYHYSANNPIVFTDPTGQYSEDKKNQYYGFGLDHSVPKNTTVAVDIQITGNIKDKNDKVVGMTGNQTVTYKGENGKSFTHKVTNVRWVEDYNKLEPGNLPYESPASPEVFQIFKTTKKYPLGTTHPDQGIFIHKKGRSEGCILFDLMNPTGDKSFNDLMNRVVTNNKVLKGSINSVTDERSKADREQYPVYYLNNPKYWFNKEE